MATQFTAEVESTGKTTTGIRVPEPALDDLGAGRRPRVAATIDGGYVLRTTVGVHDGAPFLSVSGAVREQAGLAAGDMVEVSMQLDTTPVTIDVPEDLVAALAGQPEARAFFDGLTASQRRTFVDSVTGAKQPETRARRVERAVAALCAGQKRP
ncbi:MAG: DUF1905 domain-containing protein [Actinobacteria bacterium]|jgi:hypothetical protein|nr:DUF1905 domain-containing protein [Actinomycetota bacterium]